MYWECSCEQVHSQVVITAKEDEARYRAAPVDFYYIERGHSRNFLSHSVPCPISENNLLHHPLFLLIQDFLRSLLMILYSLNSFMLFYIRSVLFSS